VLGERVRAHYSVAKGRDHEIMRALETHPKSLPWNIEIEFYVVTSLLV
jgi:hypothetical protein